MKVLYYSRMLQVPTGGGAHARGLVEGLARAGYEVLSLPAGAPLDAAAHRPKGLPIPEAAKVIGREMRARRWLRASDPLVRDALGYTPDVTIVRRTTYDLVADRIVGEIGGPIIAEVNAVVAKEAEKWGERLSRAEIAREREFMLAATRVSCVSTEVADDVAEMGVPRERIVTVENGVDENEFSPDISPDDRIAEWAGSRDGVVAYCGGVGALRDLDALIAAAERLAVIRPGAGFVWVGLSEQQLREKVSPLLADASFAAGIVEHKAVARLLAAADVFWCAFHVGYVSPLKVYEYAALGKPIVAAAYGMPARTVESSGAGLAVAPGDVAGLSERVRELLDDRQAAQRLGARGREWVLSSHTWEHVARAMLEGL